MRHDKSSKNPDMAVAARSENSNITYHTVFYLFTLLFGILELI